MSIGIGAHDLAEVGHRIGQPAEAQRTADRTVVAEQAGRPAAAGQVQVRPAVAVAVEDGHPAADRQVRVPLEREVQPGRRRLVDEVGRAERRRATPDAEDGHPGHAGHQQGHDHDPENRQGPSPAGHPQSSSALSGKGSAIGIGREAAPAGRVEAIEAELRDVDQVGPTGDHQVGRHPGNGRAPHHPVAARPRRR